MILCSCVTCFLIHWIISFKKGAKNRTVLKKASRIGSWHWVKNNLKVSYVKILQFSGYSNITLREKIYSRAETFAEQTFAQSILAILASNCEIKFRKNYWNWHKRENLFLEIQLFSQFLFCVLQLRSSKCTITIEKER